MSDVGYICYQILLGISLILHLDFQKGKCILLPVFPVYFSVVLSMCLCTFRLHNAVQAKQKDKQAVGQLEKRLKAEQEARATAEKQLADEKKRKKLEEATAARAVALAAASR